MKIQKLTKEAFQDVPHSKHNEQFIIDGLRNDNSLTISLVAEVEGKIVGHVAVSPVTISDGSLSWYGLGPISVVPEFQSNGIGTELMKCAIEKLKEKSANGCVLLGDPNYYDRFGFKAESGLVFSGVPQEYFQAILFGSRMPSGEVIYHKSFYNQGINIR
ncbi:Acetyltransferase, GNAT family [hydrothermal vent metagenome]|uniref:Acetyltransferase, GNAT family n=1 Tax=hydrothermal vent metagenome TaxID=652676 RepID=A0A3B1DT29_9ZZZZ